MDAARVQVVGLSWLLHALMLRLCASVVCAVCWVLQSSIVSGQEHATTDQPGGGLVVRPSGIAYCTGSSMLFRRRAFFLCSLGASVDCVLHCIMQFQVCYPQALK
eukprot:GHRQ01021209.1.p2 GENE.GHRQ01021209.1~~GHRQ01021209.1.p2  ORF type:complete len:105 (-),score=8.78 GHRQ01021209.1:15-329(-)